VALGLAVWNGVDSGLHIGNGLGIPVVVEIDGEQKIEVPAGKQVHVGLSGGVHLLRSTTTDGVLLEELPVALRTLNTNLYSVLGTTPFYTMPVVYRRTANPEADAAIQPRSLLGSSSAHLSVDYAFTEPPSSLSMKSSESSVTRTFLGMADGGWSAFLGGLDPVQGLRLLRRAYNAEPEATREKLWTFALFSMGPEATMYLAQQTGTPEQAQIAAALIPQDVATLRAAAAAAPADPIALQRLAEALPLSEAEALYRAFLKENPDDSTVTLQLANLLADSNRAAAAWTTVAALPSGPEVDQMRASILAKLGKLQDALDLIPTTAEGDTAIYRARLSALAGVTPAPPASQLLYARCIMFSTPDIQRSELPKGLSDDEVRLLNMEWAAVHNPEEAWRILQKASIWELRSLHRHVTLLLGLEFLRAGDPLLGMALLDLDRAASDGTWDQALNPDQPLPVIVEHMSGAMRGVVLFVRSRVRQSQGLRVEAEKLQKAALVEEDVPGVVHLVAPNWPAL
jgi:tetratricopeptide (TPR) repeat protein